jgi:hypothetical protein
MRRTTGTLTWWSGGSIAMGVPQNVNSWMDLDGVYKWLIYGKSENYSKLDDFLGYPPFLGYFQLGCLYIYMYTYCMFFVLYNSHYDIPIAL